MMRPEVEEALREALAEWDGQDLPNSLLEQASSDCGFNLSWTKPGEARRILRALIELGVVLGLAAADRAVQDTDVAGRDTLKHALRDIRAITVASVLEGEK